MRCRRPLPTDRAVGIMEEELEERAVAALFREELARLRKDTDGALSERNFTNFVSRPAVRAKLADAPRARASGSEVEAPRCAV